MTCSLKMPPLPTSLTLAQFQRRMAEKRARDDNATNKEDHRIQLTFKTRIDEAMDEGDRWVNVYVPYHRTSIPEMISSESLAQVNLFLGREYPEFTMQILVVDKKYKVSWSW